jgi:hypothetical protein
MSHKISLNSEELKEFLTYIHANNKVLLEKKLPVQTVNVEGEAGGGKTSTILQLSQDLGLKLIRKNLAELEDVSDLVGYPCKEHEMVSNKDGSKRWVVEGAIPQYIQGGFKPTGELRMVHATPDWIQGEDKPVLLLLDDYSRASEKFIQATMTLIETQCYNGWCLPVGSFIVLTSNPDNGKYSVSALDSAQRTRVINVNYKYDNDVWARHSEKTGIDGRCINFMLLHPEVMEAEDINARTVTMFFNSLMSIKDFSEKLSLIQQLGESTTNAEFSTLFTTFIANKLDKLITPRDILLMTDEKKVTERLIDCTGIVTDSDYRADIAAVLVTRLINFTMQYAEENPVTPAVIDRLIYLITTNIFSNDLTYMIVKKILNSNKQKFQKLMLNQEVVKIAMK